MLVKLVTNIRFQLSRAEFALNCFLMGRISQVVAWSFADPAAATGSEAEVNVLGTTLAKTLLHTLTSESDFLHSMLLLSRRFFLTKWTEFELTCFCIFILQIGPVFNLCFADYGSFCKNPRRDQGCSGGLAGGEEAQEKILNCICCN